MPAKRRTPGATISPAQPTPTRAITIAPASLRGQVVQFWHPYSAEAQVLLDLMTQEFNKTNPWGIQVENLSLPGFTVLQARLRQAGEGGQLPDVWTAPTFQALLLDAGGEAVADLSPYISDLEYGLSLEEQRDFLTALWNQDRIPAPALKGHANPQGKHIGLPWVRGGILLLYNHTWAQELGFPRAPESHTGFRDQACAAARRNTTDSDRQNNGTGGWMLTGDPAELSGWLYAFGAEVVREDGRGYQFDTPAARQAFEYVAQLAAGGCLWQAGEASLAQALAQRRALFLAVSLADLPQLRVELEALEAADEWQILPFPSPGGQPAVVAYGYSLVLSRSTPERQLAGWLFMRWLSSSQNQARWAQYNFSLPSRRSAPAEMQTGLVQNRDWVDALDFLPYLHAEPYYASWQNVRWSLGDALNQLVSAPLGPQQPIEILRMLDGLAAEIHLQIR
jgi:multiple sugar transport system substrate-binding protein/sn-glycerol 3-phosphate transport system substrate-binding protein